MTTAQGITYKTTEAAEARYYPPVTAGHGIRIDVEFDGPVDPELARVLVTAAAKAFATTTKPAFVRALVELI